MKWTKDQGRGDAARYHRVRVRVRSPLPFSASASAFSRNPLPFSASASAFIKIWSNSGSGSFSRTASGEPWECKDKRLSLSEFPWYMALVEIIKTSTIYFERCLVLPNGKAYGCYARHLVFNQFAKSLKSRKIGLLHLVSLITIPSYPFLLTLLLNDDFYSLE